MTKFLNLLADIDKDFNVALDAIIKAKALVILIPVYGPEIVATAEAIKDLENKLGLLNTTVTISNKEKK